MDFTDILPTFAEWAGIDLSNIKYDGISLAPFLKRKQQYYQSRDLFISWASKIDKNQNTLIGSGQPTL